MADHYSNRDRNRFYNRPDEAFANRGRQFDRDFEEDFDDDMRFRGERPGFGRGYGRDFDQSPGQYYGRETGGRGSYGAWGRRGFPPQGYGASGGGYGRNYSQGGYSRSFYDNDFEDDSDYGAFRGGDYGYGRGMHRRFGGQGYDMQGDFDRRYGRGSGMQSGYGQSGYSRGFGPQGYNPGYGYEDFYSEDDFDYDMEPAGFSYTEIWLVPGPFTGMGPQGYQRSDERIHEEICERLTQHGRIDARNIQVQVKNGEVTLTGSVDKRRAKRMVEDTIDSISGVKEVHNQLRVEQNKDHQQRQGQSQQQTGQHTAGQQPGQPFGQHSSQQAETQTNQQRQRAGE